MTGNVLSPAKLNVTSVGPKRALGVNAMTNDCTAPGAIVAGVFGVPISALVAGLVVW